MPGKLPTISRCPVSNCKQIDARLTAGEGHVSHFLAPRRKARCQDQVVTLRQVTQIGAILIHDGKLLLSVVARACFGDEDNTGVEVATLTG